jgi:hypothetical protein
VSTRRTQPYRQGARNPGAALQAMTRGSDFQGGNPMDSQRAVQRLVQAGQQVQARKARAARPARPARS